MIFLKKLLEIYEEEFKLNLEEGLIKTTNLGQTLSILKKGYSNKYNFSSNQDGNSFNIQSFNIDLNNIEELIKKSNTLGWFPSWLETDEYKGKWNPNILKNSKEIEKLRFEAKYDFKIDKIPDILYHLAPEKNWEKISKLGLLPKSRSKASYHPERVYLTQDEKSAKSLAELFYQKTGEKEYALIKIETTLIPDYFKLYKDPNFKNGYYTMNNIPPNVIEKINTIKK